MQVHSVLEICEGFDWLHKNIPKYVRSNDCTWAQMQALDLCFTILAVTLCAGMLTVACWSSSWASLFDHFDFGSNMKIGRVSSLQYYCHGATRTRETQQGNGLQQSVDTCVRPDRNRLCGLRHLAAHSPRSHQNGDSGHDSKARLEQEFQSLYIADVVLRSHRQQDKKSWDGRTGDDLMLVKDSNYLLVQYVCLTSQ